MTPGEPLPDKITLSRAEAATILFALEEAIERADADEALRLHLEGGADHRRAVPA